MDFAQRCITPTCQAALKEVASKVRQRFAGDDLEKKEEAELRRLNIDARRQEVEVSRLQIQRLRHGLNEIGFSDEAILRKLKIAKLREETGHQRRALEETIELRRQKLRLLQDAQREKSQLRRLKIERLATVKEKTAFRELRTKVMQRRLRDFDERAVSIKQADKALQRYRRRKLDCLERQAKLWAGINFPGYHNASPTPKARKRDDRHPYATSWGFDAFKGEAVVGESSLAILTTMGQPSSRRSTPKKLDASEPSSKSPRKGKTGQPTPPDST
ncbi:hypothetical protein EG327_005026 [Venturia inaequalis]|uniref:Uncharacterized protein n=1 Tax=Venturia inaequalis TaxID=5025 RepID=A0A8H3VCJ5_VENIN|nr:hypothetical protein EG327_005026 [Venturia inaequalis]